MNIAQVLVWQQKQPKTGLGNCSFPNTFKYANELGCSDSFHRGSPSPGIQALPQDTTFQETRPQAHLPTANTPALEVVEGSVQLSCLPPPNFLCCFPVSPLASVAIREHRSSLVNKVFTNGGCLPYNTHEGCQSLLSLLVCPKLSSSHF